MGVPAIIFHGLSNVRYKPRSAGTFKLKKIVYCNRHYLPALWLLVF